MRCAVLLALLAAGCGAAQNPEPATQETAVLVFGSGRPARASLRSAVRAMQSRLPRPLSQEPAEVAARMSGALDRAAGQEKASAEADRRRRDAEFEESMQRTRERWEGNGGIGLGGIGGLGLRGSGTGGGGVGLGGLGGIGTRGTGRASAPPSKPKKK